jgi:hypothetical protein
MKLLIMQFSATSRKLGFDKYVGLEVVIAVIMGGLRCTRIA